MLTFGCSDSTQIDNDIEVRAIKISKNINSVSLKTFKEWNFFPRGQTGIWSKISADSTRYSCIYTINKDTITLAVLRPVHFSKDFTFNDTFDFTKYHRIDLSMHNGVVKVSALDSHGITYILGIGFQQDRLFGSTNPFEKFRELTALKDTLGFIATSYRSDIGNFIQFYITPNHILTYIPDDLNLNPKFKDVWLNTFSSGKTINAHWNFRKTESPLDNG
jgi:hypothetical protein